ncbi:high mobility group box-domain-containing protein [Podospora fimiseda]|uniref:High mobility group box-domain-containing protein n=1 Tax=Podospora fimiseda TaxID=252190 RepID=A0AAN7GNN1_9PEZI|nr:high mobility group box-domain-containing protein [Podospora fimiseda]
MSFAAQVNVIAGLTSDRTPLSFLFWGNEMIIQCIAVDDDHSNIVAFLRPVADKFKVFINGHDAALVHRLGTRMYYVVTVAFAMTLNHKIFGVLSTTYGNTNPALNIAVAASEELPELDSMPMIESKNIVKNGRIPRPRNQFILYRQWMSTRLQAENPGLTAGSISQVVSQMWHAEKPKVKAHFKALAGREDRIHKARFPGYRYETGQTRVDRRIHASPEKLYTIQETAADIDILLGGLLDGLY